MSKKAIICPIGIQRIESIRCMGHHGANPGEQDNPQLFVVHVALGFAVEAAIRGDELPDTINWSDCRKATFGVLEDYKFTLVEGSETEPLPTNETQEVPVDSEGCGEVAAAVVVDRRYKLVEKIAGEITLAILGLDDRIEWVKVKVEKPHAWRNRVGIPSIELGGHREGGMQPPAFCF